MNKSRPHFNETYSYYIFSYRATFYEKNFENEDIISLYDGFYLHSNW